VVQPRAHRSGPLRALFVGNLGQAKGLSYLGEAMRMIPRDAVALTLIGKRVCIVHCAPLEAMLCEHHHINGLPQEGVLAAMPSYDVLVLPTLFEGMSLTVLEAMSQGLAVITSTQSGYLGVMQSGTQGFVIAPRDPRALADALMTLAQDRGALQAMKNAGLAMAARFSAASYRQRLAQLVADEIGAGN
jgi:alpha-maltose-1-phosphate synthase